MNTYKNWSLQSDDQNILWLTFSQENSQINSLNEATLSELDHIINALTQNTQAKAVIIRSGKKSGFIAGADIAQFKMVTSKEQAVQFIKRGQEVFNRLERLTIPTIALIDGFCLGGGLELAMACRYRIAHDSVKTRLGLPEVKLGIHPGWGGTVRLPPLVGIMSAIDLICTGRNLSAKAAKKIGLINEAVPERLLEKVALYYALHSPATSPLKGFKWILQQATQFEAMRSFLGQFFKYQLQKNKVNINHYPAPYKVIENWVLCGDKRPEALDLEAQSIGQLLISDTSRNLVRVFFLQDLLKGLAKGVNFKPQHVHVVGAGVMGGDIAAWCIACGYTVTLQDQAPPFIGSAVKRTFELVSKRLKEGNVVQAAMDKLFPDPHGLGIAKADIIIEAITEKLQAKQDLFVMLEKYAKPNAILATNTSTIPLEEIGAVLKNPQRLVGVHFFNPVAKMPLVEVVHGHQTDAQIIDQAIAFVRCIDKYPLPVRSSPGFLVNRILLPYLLEAVTLFEEGVPASVIDQAAIAFGMPMGPIELADVVGLDICFAALEQMTSHLGGHIPHILREHVMRAELGRKTGKGFYVYKNGKMIKSNMPEKQNIPSDVTHRLILRILNEAVACLREGIVDSADKVDAGCIFGFGFPPFRGGPITYARFYGEERLLKLFKEFEARYGQRFAPDAGWHSSTLPLGQVSR